MVLNLTLTILFTHGRIKICPIVIIIGMLKMGHHRPLFLLFSVYSNKQYNYYNKVM